MKEIYNLKRHNTFGLVVVADRFVEYASEDALQSLIRDGALQGRLLHIGAGSNLLFLNPVFHGTVLHSCIREIELLEENADSVIVRVGAGVVWDDFVAYCVKQGWYGAENLSLVPGEVGASAVQNIGAYGTEVKDLVTEVETIDMNGRKRVFSNKECCYAYRDSIFKREDMRCFYVTHVRFRLSKNEHYHTEYGVIRQELQNRNMPLSLSAVREIIMDIRRSKLPDPEVLGNAGSFFKNPIVPRPKYEALKVLYDNIPFYEVDEGSVKIPAGWLIEQSGWKGKSLGKAAVHDKQALVLVNKGGATGADIVALSDIVRRDVAAKFDIDIEPEVNFID